MRVWLTVIAILSMFSGAPRPAAAVARVAPTLVIVDTDLGDDIDDAFALALAVRDPRLNVVGVTTAWGDTLRRVWLARRLLAAAARADIPVAQGVATADGVRFTQAAWAQGASDRSPAPSAVDFIRAQVRQHPGAITLIALAPMSNIQDLITRDAATARRLRRVVFMGGSVRRGYPPRDGHPSGPSAEYNVASRPKALEALLALGVPVTMFPLDSTQLGFDTASRDRLFGQGGALGTALAQLYGQWRRFNAWGRITPTLFDVVPVAALADPAICPTRPMRIAVDAAGFTRPVAGPANLDVCLALDEAAAQAIIQRALGARRGATSR